MKVGFRLRSRFPREKAQDGVLGVTNIKGWAEEAKFQENKTKLRRGEDPKGCTEEPRGWSDSSWGAISGAEAL